MPEEPKSEPWKAADGRGYLAVQKYGAWALCTHPGDPSTCPTNEETFEVARARAECLRELRGEPPLFERVGGDSSLLRRMKLALETIGSLGAEPTR